MLPTVEFDDELHLFAEEVGDVDSDRRLAAELEAEKLARSDLLPEPSLGFRGVAAKVAAYVDVELFRYAPIPSPRTAPNGRGSLASPGDEMGVLEALLLLAVAEGAGFLAVLQRHHAAAGGFEDGLAGGGVPFHGGAVARINVGRAFGEHAEFERGA